MTTTPYAVITYPLPATHGNRYKHDNAGEQPHSDTTGTLLSRQPAAPVQKTQLRQWTEAPAAAHANANIDVEQTANDDDTDATEFTEYRHVTQSNHSTGFNKAKEIAQAALVRTAAVDPGGSLWVSLVTQATYAEDAEHPTAGPVLKK